MSADKLEMTMAGPPACLRFFSIVQWILAGQLAVALMAGVLCAVVYDEAAGLWALVGGLIALIPNLVFSLGFGVRNDRRSAREVAKLFYVGEVVKLLLTVLLFFVAFNWSGVRVMPLLAGFVVTLNVFWFSLLVRRERL